MKLSPDLGGCYVHFRTSHFCPLWAFWYKALTVAMVILEQAICGRCDLQWDKLRKLGPIS